MLTPAIHPHAARDLQLAHVLRDEDVDPDYIRLFGNMSVLAAYDRKVTRSYMIDVINLNAQMNYALLNLSKAGTARHMLERMGQTESPVLDETAKRLTSKVMRFRGLLADKVTLLAECPNEDDTIY